MKPLTKDEVRTIRLYQKRHPYDKDIWMRLWNNQNRKELGQRESTSKSGLMTKIIPFHPRNTR